MRFSYMDNCQQEIKLLFETSWEVCNKIGGIYTVLSTKAATLKEQFKDNLIFIGPDVWSADSPCPCFTENRTLLRRWAQKALLPEGVDIRIGRWDIPGRPVAVLVKFDGMYADKDRAYGRMWELFGVDSLHAYGDYDEGCAFARAAAAVIKSFVEVSGTDPRAVVAHFDEWTTAMGLLTLRADAPDIATVFTTHATSIGRSICGNGKPLYDHLADYDGDQMAAQLNMQSKHSLEKAAAWNADCFTTVSDVTAAEATQLLSRKPDIVTPNGFDPSFVPQGRKYTAARNKARARLLDVASALTGIEFAPDTFIVATSGRCEYRNKGLDLFLDAMAALRREPDARRVLAFVMVPAWCGAPRPDLQHALAMNEHNRLGDPVLTHLLNNYGDDPVNRRIHEIGFTNDAASQVTVIYVPDYLNGADGIFDIPYYGLLPGMDATVFASYYEPWGYTPLESIAFGVPTVTTSLSGFGCWVKEQWGIPGFRNCGVTVAERTDSNYADVVADLVKALTSLEDMDATAAAQVRGAATDASKKALWSQFIAFYDQAYCVALSHRDERTLR